MKRAIFPALLLLLTLPACAQKLGAEVPQAVKSGFSNAHPNVTGKWEKEGGDYEVSFKEKGKEMSCVVNATGVILETEIEIAVPELPQEARNYVVQHYPKAKIKEAAKIVKAGGEVIYEAQINKEDLLFDASGKFVKVDKKAGDKK